LKPIKVISVKHPVMIIKVSNEGNIFIFDTNNILRIYDENFKLKGGNKIKMPSHNPFENTADISNKGNFLAIAEIKGKKTFIWDIKNKKMKYKFGWHRGEVLNVSFDWDENYLLTGGSDGRAYIWSLKFGKMLMPLPPHPDYILSGGFSKNNLWTATGSYDRLITISNISSSNLFYRKKSHRGAVNKIRFFNNNIMISGDKTGELIKWDYRKGKILNRFPNMADMVVDFVSDENNEFLFAITKEKRVYLYDFETAELITQDFIKISTFPSAIAYNYFNSHLYIGCIDGSVYIYDLLEDKNKLNELIENKKYNEAYELVKSNPILKRTDEYKTLENIWEKTFSAINKLLEKGQIDEAKVLFEPFKNNPIKRNLFQNLLKDFDDFEKFKHAVLNKRYPLAYSLVRKFPVYKQSIYYKKMEEDFKKAFNKAREFIKQNKEAKAREILKPFAGVSDKVALIQSLFTEKQLYDIIKNKLAKKDFESFFDFVKRYPFLTDSPEYHIALKYGEKLLDIANEALKKGEYRNAIKYANILEQFPMYKDVAKEIKQKAINISNFLMYIANNDYDRVEDLINKYSYLENIDDYKKFMEKYKNLIAQAEDYAIKGDVKSLKEKYSNLVKYRLFKNALYNLVKRAYLNQIILLSKSDNLKKLKIAIENYIKLFGFDNEIGDILKLVKKKGLNITIENYEKSIDIPFESLPDNIADIRL